MEKLYVIVPNKNTSEVLSKMIDSAIKNHESTWVDDINNVPDLKNKKLIFAMELADIGYDIPMIEFLAKLYSLGYDTLKGSIGTVLVHSNNEYSTKRAAQDLIFIANRLGCAFIGHPIVEATHSLRNFKTWKKTLNLSLEEICLEMCKKLSERLIKYSPVEIKNPNLLVLYSMPHKTSNTVDLWHMVSKFLDNYNIKELQIESGEVQDCRGCAYKTCIHYAEGNKCFYGGIMVKEVLPSIENADAVIWLCPNYNDAIAANLTAVINRLTVLYRKISFENKTVFGVIVSGNSGSDSIAKQLIGSLNINKGFHLPPYFCITAIANDPHAIFEIPDIEKKAEAFAYNIKDNI